VRSLASLLPADWRAALHSHLASKSCVALEEFVGAERSRFDVLPPESSTFAAFHLTPLDDVKVVMLGQDPYPTSGVANGLAFSVAPGAKIPASLKNLLRQLALETGEPLSKSGDLTPWAKKGVLLTNVVFTVRAGASQSHQNRGWESFTDAVLDVVSKCCRHVVFVAIGKPAAQRITQVSGIERHTVLTVPHPSPLNGKKFETHARAHGFFSAINEALRARDCAEIDWSLGA
jgi:uracil-DNA glycosylase